jgi:uncharacterized protein YdiU (UPF0061 family)
LVHASEEVAALLGISTQDLTSASFLEFVSGKKIWPETKPYAMNYAGHQFGHWAGQLGDGRAIVLGEIVHNHHSWMVQLKGAGQTPYSRRADGLAVLRSSIREHLCSEAMHHLGVPTTRSLALVETGDLVLRDILYNGNSAYEKGAVVCRVAPTFIRFGNFELLAAQNDIKNLTALADFTITHHFPYIQSSGTDKYLDFFKEVTSKTLEVMVAWQRVGFVHGVMNTDNMSILGLTLDYGPYGWLEDYNPDWTPNTTDSEHKRYRFGNQPYIALWNLYQLANALYPLIREAAPMETILECYKTDYEKDYEVMMKRKIGLFENESNDALMLQSLEELLQATETDMTLFFRLLGTVLKESSREEAFQQITEAFYNGQSLNHSVKESFYEWFDWYLVRLRKERQSDFERKVAMDAINPKYVLRNYMAQLAIEDAEKGIFDTIIELHTVLKKPYEEQPEFEKWFAKRPEWARHKVGCSMLSCSS